jgi:hypothetical protein
MAKIYGAISATDAEIVDLGSEVAWVKQATNLAGGGTDEWTDFFITNGFEWNPSSSTNEKETESRRKVVTSIATKYGFKIGTDQVGDMALFGFGELAIGQLTVFLKQLNDADNLVDGEVGYMACIAKLVNYNVVKNKSGVEFEFQVMRPSSNIAILLDIADHARAAGDIDAETITIPATGIPIGRLWVAPL